jgi:hypothetical protein
VIEAPSDVVGKQGIAQQITDDVESLPADGRKAEAPPPVVETRRRDGCEA